MTDIKKTRKTKKAAVKKAEVKKAEAKPEQEQEPSNQPATSRTDDPAKRGYLGAYSSHHDSRDLKGV